jgi:hypothetical protein
MKSTRNRVALFASTATLAGAGLAATAQAEPVDVVGGETELKVNKDTATALEDLGVSAEGTTYEVKGGEYDFAPIEEGGGGVLKHGGALKLSTDDVKVKLSGFRIELNVGNDDDDKKDDDEKARAKNDTGVLTAKVGGERIEVGRLNTRNYESDEAMYSFEGLRVVLSKEAAKALNQAFETKAFEQGIKLGKLENQSEVE